MLELNQKRILYYKNQNGETPFLSWLESLRDQVAKAKVRVRLDRLRFGHYGDHHFIGNGIQELRIHYGPGYRIYFAEYDSNIVLLLTGGDKGNQKRDIKRVQKYWQDYKENNS